MRQAGEVAELADEMLDGAMNSGSGTFSLLDRALCDMGLKDEFLMVEEGGE